MEPLPSRPDAEAVEPPGAPAPHAAAADDPAPPAAPAFGGSRPSGGAGAGGADAPGGGGGGVPRRIETLQPIEHPARFESQAGLKVRSRRRRVSLLRAIAADMGNNFFTYFLAAVLCALSIYKVVQVQETRDLIANLNEVTVHNENLNKDWLTLLAQRQALSEHNKIRREAAERLKMKAPRTEAEKVITLN